jgi:hypothetical protein
VRSAPPLSRSPGVSGPSRLAQRQGRALRALCVLGPRVGGRGALVGLRGLREGLVARVTGGADKRLSLGPHLVDRLLRLRLRTARALLGRGDAFGLVRLGPRDRAVAVLLGDGDADLGLLADPVELGAVRRGGLGQAVVRLAGPRLLGGQVLAHLLGGLVRHGAGTATAKWLRFTGKRAPTMYKSPATETEPQQVSNLTVAQIQWHRTRVLDAYGVAPDAARNGYYRVLGRCY